MSKAAKRSRQTGSGRTAVLDAEPDEIPVVGGREPCPCGSGRRYKACHGRLGRAAATRLVTRPFEGLVGECDWVALHEIVPAATARARVRAEHGGGEVTVATVLPMAWPAMRRADGSVYVGLQTARSSQDPSRDVAAALLAAMGSAPGTAVDDPGPSGSGPRLQDVIEEAGGFQVSVHSGFDFWLDGVEDATPEVRESLERANAAVAPTTRLSSVEAAYWCRIGERRHLRWVLPDAEDRLLDGLARLHAGEGAALVPGSRYLGAFRTHGLVVPVWDLAAGTEAADLEEPIAAFAGRLAAAVGSDAPLTPEQRRARAGVVARQLTLR